MQGLRKFSHLYPFLDINFWTFFCKMNSPPEKEEDGEFWAGYIQLRGIMPENPRTIGLEPFW